MKGAGSTQRKSEFRLKWAQLELKDKVKKSKAEHFKEELGEEGRYMVFDKLCIAERWPEQPSCG